MVYVGSFVCVVGEKGRNLSLPGIAKKDFVHFILNKYIRNILYYMVYTIWNVASVRGEYGSWFTIALLFNYANISLHTVSKKDSSNDIPLNLPNTFYGYPLFMALRI